MHDVKQDLVRMSDRLHSAAIHLLRAVRVHDTKSGVTAARLSALSVISYSDGITISKLAAAEQVRLPTMSRLVAGMEADGLIERRSSQTDARSTIIHATASGREILDRGRGLRLHEIERRLSTCSDEELMAMQEAVATLERLFGTHSTDLHH